jgi:hypothetical protein
LAGKFGKYALLACLVVTIVGAGSYFAWPRIHTDYFYRTRPILSAMNSAHDGVRTNNSTAARDALLRMIPVGTNAPTVITSLSTEGFNCLKPNPTSDPAVNCQLLAPAGFGSTRWIIDLQFGSRDDLIGAKVAIWNIFL